MAPVQRNLTCSNSLILNCTCLQDLKSHDTVQIHTKNSKVGQPEANELQMILKRSQKEHFWKLTNLRGSAPYCTLVQMGSSHLISKIEPHTRDVKTFTIFHDPSQKQYYICRALSQVWLFSSLRATLWMDQILNAQ